MDKTLVKLGDVCDILNGYAFRSENYTKSGIRVIRIQNVQKGFIEDNNPEFYPDSYYEELENYMLYKNDLLMSLTGNVGRVAILNEELLPAALNQRVACLRLKNNISIDKKYLFHYLNSDFFENKCRESSNGSAQKNLKTEWLKNHSFFVYSLDQQHKIVATLDQVNDLISLRSQQLEQLDLLIKSRFVEMFGDFTVNNKNWEICSFSDFAIIDGNMINDFEKYADYPHIGIDSIEKETGELKGYRTVKEDNVISGKYLFTPEHIIYSKIRPNLNKVALPNFTGLCSADSYPILPIKNKCNRVFLAYNMRSKFYLDYILKFCKRTNMPKVNREQVCSFKSPLPPLALQNQFADFVTEVEKQKSTVKQSLEQLETLKKKLMQDYFG